MKNRFENYISNQYQSQFTPTPIDANMGFNMINARQGYYDNIMQSIDKLNPDLQYIAPNQYDQGDLPIANQLYQQRAQEQQKLIDDILKTDNLNDASRRVAKLATDPTYRQTSEVLRMRKLQYEQNRKMLEDSFGKDVGFNDYLTHYEKNRLTPFDLTNYGLNSAIGAQTPDASKLAKEWASILEYDEIPLSQGQFIGRTGDGQYYVSVDGKKQTISQQKAFDTLSSGIMGDPTVQNWLGVMNRIGKGKEAQAMIASQIGAAVRGKSFSRTDVSYGYHQSPYDVEYLKKGLEDPEFDPNAQTSSVFAPTGFTNSNTLEINNQGLLQNKNISDKELAGMKAAGYSGGMYIPSDAYSLDVLEGKMTQAEADQKRLQDGATISGTLNEKQTISYLNSNPATKQIMNQYGYDVNKKEDRQKIISQYNKVVEANKSREEYYNPIPAEKQQKVEAQNYGNEKIYYNLKTAEVQTFNDLDFDWESAVKIGNGKPSKAGAVKGDVIQDKNGNMFAVTNETDQSMVHYGGWNVIRSGMHDPNRTMDKIMLPTVDGGQQSARVYYYYDDSGKKRALTVPEEYSQVILEKANDTKTTKEFYDVLKEYAYPEDRVEELFDESFKIKYNKK